MERVGLAFLALLCARTTGSSGLAARLSGAIVARVSPVQRTDLLTTTGVGPLCRPFFCPQTTIFQVLKGEIKETRYSLAPDGRSNDGERKAALRSSASNAAPGIASGADAESLSVGGSELEAGGSLVKTSTVTCHPGAVTYIEDSMGLHKMENPSSTEECISLHLYSPGISECTTWADASSCTRCEGDSTRSRLVRVFAFFFSFRFASFCFRLGRWSPYGRRLGRA